MIIHRSLPYMVLGPALLEEWKSPLIDNEDARSMELWRLCSLRRV